MTVNSRRLELTSLGSFRWLIDGTTTIFGFPENMTAQVGVSNLVYHPLGQDFDNKARVATFRTFQDVAKLFGRQG